MRHLEAARGAHSHRVSRPGTKRGNAATVPELPALLSGDRKIDPLGDSNSDPHPPAVRPLASRSQPTAPSLRCCPGAQPVVEAPFPDGFSVYGEAVVGWDAVRLGGLRQRHLHLSLAVEAFTWGRVDVDGRLAAQLVERRVEVAVSALATGVGRPGARYLYSGEVRWRFGGWLYAVGQGGTLLFPASDGTLRPGAFASLGLGVDHAR
jgi:hypothetical protein